MFQPTMPVLSCTDKNSKVEKNALYYLDIICYTAMKILREVELNHIILRNFRNVLRRKLWVKLIRFRPVECYGNFTFPYQFMIILNSQLVNSFNSFNISTAISAASVSAKELCLQEVVEIFVSNFHNILIITTISINTFIVRIL